jgi:hypothetical protein
MDRLRGFLRKRLELADEGGEFKWPTRIVLTMGAPAKSKRVKESPKAATHIAAIIAETLARLLQASANADTQIASRTVRMAVP